VSNEALAGALAKQFRHTYVSDGESGLKKELIAAFKPLSPKVEALRALRMQLMVDSLNRHSNALAVVSPSSGDGRTFLAANLAILFAQLGERTVLLDAHMQKPRLHQIFSIDHSVGLSAVLAGRPGGQIAAPVKQFENLWLIPAGAAPPNPDELLARSSFSDFCNKLMAEYDIVLVDTAPGSSSTCAISAANSCGKAVLVARRDRTRFADVSALVGRLGKRVDVVGSVLNRH
jgi:chain length determinant protein tyrosine kinase EpsG